MRPGLPILLLLPVLGACGDDDHGASDTSTADTSTADTSTPDTGDTDAVLEVPEVYAFESAFVSGESSVAYDGQTMRHVLIEDLERYIGSLTTLIDAGTYQPTTQGEVVAALDYYFRFDSDSSGGDAHGISTTPAPVQATYDDISKGKNLVDKLAGNDASTDHVDFKAGGFKGWSDASIAAHGGGIGSPEALVIAFFSTIEAQAIARVNGTIPKGPGDVALPVHVTPEGLDLAELVQKFLTGAIAFSQGADDYLDDDVAGKGLYASNLAPAEGGKHTELEHAWDEGFGYFGAARDYAGYSDELLAGATPYRDSDTSGAIDLLSERSYGHSTNAAKRDRGARPGGETDLTAEAIAGFLEGRAIITRAAGRALTEGEMSALVAARDRAVGAWEKAIAATALHYVNDVLKAMAKIDGEGYDLLAHAKAWSELKGFALSLQFNPRSPLSDEDFDALHAKIGDRPVLAPAGATALDAYRVALREARALLVDAYDFPAANTGGDHGEDGW
ncbi:MAG: DUF4856 domain-containing protein [Deltaproteobacteria bacterium]|nr:DUF4856 domain-containing protein [Deltaproteobacteria bacterium]